MKSNTLNFGIIGNCQSSALINEDSSIDWCCLPQFDSASVFAKILDTEKGGNFKIECVEKYNTSQKYIDNTSILVTKFDDGENSFELIDFMPRYQKENGSFYSPPEIIRFIKLIKGKPKLKVLYDPKLEYALGNTNTYVKEEFIVSVVDEKRYGTLYLYTNLDKNDILERNEIEIDNNYFLSVSYNEKINPVSINQVVLDFEKTKIYWMNWCYKTPKFKNYNSEILRSAMTLKLLTFEKTGAVLAAATTSLPETIGEVRNWDYRFCWIRDASMVIKIITKLGHKKIVKNFIDFIVNLIPDKNEKLQIMYGISGEKNLTEKILDHFAGYQNSKPVRIGNAAYSQKQNDIYGILMDAIHFQIDKYREDNDKHEELWSIVKLIVWVVEKNWELPDRGIWEFRNENRHFTFSKLLCWVAVDRAIKVSKIFKRKKSAKKWEILRSKIKNDIIEKGWNKNKKAFTQSYGSDDLDASVLLMEQYEFIDAMDPKYISTVKAIEKELSFEGLLFRYKNIDDFGKPSSSFTVCSFWFAYSLYKIGEKGKSKKYFDELLSYSNHLGLFSEDLDFKSKRLLGNFPQAYSHLALIETAMNFN
tara:strand:+ start:2570 stop:4336 length:1767 start_codon:yes stop_codon:yes gene_type:complete